MIESGVEFIAVDMPHANRLTLQIIAAIAEYERELTSQRTRDGMTAAKARGIKMGTRNWQESIVKARAARGFRPPPLSTITLMTTWRAANETLRTIAARLNAEYIRTPQGIRWHASAAQRALNRHTVTPS